MEKLSDLQINSTACGSMSEGISVDADDRSLSNRSNSQLSFEDEGIDEPLTLSNGKLDQITVKVCIILYINEKVIVLINSLQSKKHVIYHNPMLKMSYVDIHL